MNVPRALEGPVGNLVERRFRWRTPQNEKVRRENKAALALARSYVMRTDALIPSVSRVVETYFRGVLGKNYAFEEICSLCWPPTKSVFSARSKETS